MPQIRAAWVRISLNVRRKDNCLAFVNQSGGTLFRRRVVSRGCESPMSLRLAILLAASLLALGGGAQDELAVIGQILPTDIIFDAPPAAAPNDEVVRAADTGWGDTTVHRGTPQAPVIPVADTGWGDAMVYRGERPVAERPP